MNSEYTILQNLKLYKKQRVEELTRKRSESSIAAK